MTKYTLCKQLLSKKSTFFSSLSGDNKKRRNTIIFNALQLPKTKCVSMIWVDLWMKWYHNDTRLYLTIKISSTDISIDFLYAISHQKWKRGRKEQSVFLSLSNVVVERRKEKKVLPRFELGLLDSESNVLTARP